MFKRAALELAHALEQYSQMTRDEAREALAEERPREIAALVDPVLSGEPRAVRDKRNEPISIAEAILQSY